ncbi:hypothetical protein KIN20_005616 [Parelaphostrongylus tenuis]|uniref:Uncharacterized protein n=1 Tax=Parelaphostrongylus tenuis TaxID=148309 RepID=A0AAD5M0E8_PARTN|nr:hypothetical protein KIN20_005616 [Parelaphostrongylus tenuis]
MFVTLFPTVSEFRSKAKWRKTVPAEIILHATFNTNFYWPLYSSKLCAFAFVTRLLAKLARFFATLLCYGNSETVGKSVTNIALGMRPATLDGYHDLDFHYIRVRHTMNIAQDEELHSALYKGR